MHVPYVPSGYTSMFMSLGLPCLIKTVEVNVMFVHYGKFIYCNCFTWKDWDRAGMTMVYVMFVQICRPVCVS